MSRFERFAPFLFFIACTTTTALAVYMIGFRHVG